jgi:hypothetical protein
VIIPEAYHPSHPMGSSFCIAVDPNINNINALIYVHIPKNASCWVKYYLEQLEAFFHNYYQEFNKDKHLALVILRDPVERWISALSQFSVGQISNDRYHIDRINWEKITDSIIRDNHFQPQCDFFANIPEDKIVWFRCDSTLENTFVTFLKQYNINLKLLAQENDINNIFNITKKIPKKNFNGKLLPQQQLIVEKIKNVLDQTPRYVEKIKDLYKNDYKFLNSVTYYDPR